MPPHIYAVYFCNILLCLLSSLMLLSYILLLYMLQTPYLIISTYNSQCLLNKLINKKHTYNIYHFWCCVLHFSVQIELSVTILFQPNELLFTFPRLQSSVMNSISIYLYVIVFIFTLRAFFSGYRILD